MRHLIHGLLAILMVALPVSVARAQDGTKRPPEEKPREVAQPKRGASDGAKTDEQPKKEPDADAPAAARSDPAQRDLSEYRLRVGDVFDAIVYQHTDLTRLGITVPGNGEIAFPPIGKVKLRDRTVFEVSAEIRKRLIEEDFLTDPKVDCVITTYAPRVVYLVGAVRGTVSLPVHKNVRLLEVLAMSGSLSNPAADFSHVTVRRASEGGSSYNIDISVSDILERNDEEKNIVMFEGDYVVIRQLQTATPLSSDFVYILGKVRNPGRHPIVQGRTGFTLTKAIALAGDFDEFANRSKVVVIRKTDTGRRRDVVDFDEIIEGNRPDFDLTADDLVFVPESFF